MSFKTVELNETAGEDRVLRLVIPVEDAKRYRVIVLVEEAGEVEDTRHAQAWPPGVFESIAGQWEGDFVEESEGSLQERDSF